MCVPHTCFASLSKPGLFLSFPSPHLCRHRLKPPATRVVMQSSDSFRAKSSSRSWYHPNEPDSLKSGKVFFMAIADEFAMATLYRRLLRERSEFGGMTVSAIGSVLCITKPRADRLGISEAFIFAYGCVVCWGAQHDADDFLSLVAEDAIQLRRVPAVDSMSYEYGTVSALKHDVITLVANQDMQQSQHESTSNQYLHPSLERLAISCGLAQSIKLGAFESAMRTTIDNTRHLPEELAETGRISASRREVSRLMGRLFLDRYQYHLSGDLLMTPAFFWENEQYLPVYRRVERYLEVRERGEVLNKRVEVVQELYKLLGDELSHQNSAALELAITVMIAFEILLTLITLAKESLRSMFSACALFLCLTAIGWTVWILYRRRRASQTVTKFSKPQNGLHGNGEAR